MAAAGAVRLRRAASALLLQSPRLPVRELSAPARLYHKKVVDHYENPRNVGSLDKTSKNVGTGLVGAPACGDVMKLQIQVDEKGKIVDARFKTFGCGSAIAASDLRSPRYSEAPRPQHVRCSRCGSNQAKYSLLF
uniref:Iron-sulfur cluster assembly enzyme n=1 Tax=Molossus molossus TaxID=27622 RepID=A0A7J8BXH3_MOLMO|nr:iron-sulfur cluster assembly enzyme [Molossus molossus]